MQQPHQRRLKILALHSFRTSAAIFQTQLSRAGLLDPLQQFADIFFVDAPNLASGPIPDDVTPFFQGPYYEWWNAEKNEETGKFTYKGADTSLAHLTDIIKLHGPFDGCMGFSQGAASASLVVGAQRAGKVLKDAPQMEFLICFAGLRARDSSFKESYDALRTVPSMHIIGDRDPIKKLTNELIATFERPVVITHTRGHVIPALQGEDLHKFKAFIQSQAQQGAL